MAGDAGDRSAGAVLRREVATRLRRADRVERLGLVLLVLLLVAPFAPPTVDEWSPWLRSTFLVARPLLLVVVVLSLSRQLTLHPTLTGLRVMRALRRGELSLCFQPLVSLENGEMRAVEALVRWRRRGAVVPTGDWIEPLERSAFALRFDLWVIGQALAQADAWLRAGKPTLVAVNLSPRSLDDPTLADAIEHLLGESAVPPALVELEVTERALAQQEAGEAITRLRALGVRVMLDDFGVGYSSLLQLARLPLDGVKIDRSFVTDVHINPRSAAVVKWAAGLGREFGLSLTAEGVETEEAWRWLRQLGAEHAQGFLISEPLPPAELDAWRRWLPLEPPSPAPGDRRVRERRTGRDRRLLLPARLARADAPGHLEIV